MFHELVMKFDIEKLSNYQLYQNKRIMVLNTNIFQYKDNSIRSIIKKWLKSKIDRRQKFLLSIKITFNNQKWRLRKIRY